MKLYWIYTQRNVNKTNCKRKSFFLSTAFDNYLDFRISSDFHPFSNQKFTERLQHFIFFIVFEKSTE